MPSSFRKGETMGNIVEVPESGPRSRSGLARGVFPALAAALAILVCWAPPAASFEHVKIGDAIPAFSLADTAGGTVSSGDLGGKAAVIVFFRKGPSTAKALKRIERSYQASKDKAVGYYGLYLGKGGAEGAKALAGEGGATFPILVGTEEVYGAFGVKALPATAFFDKGGKLVHEINLAPFDLEQEASEYVLVALGEKTAQEAEMILRPQEAAALSEEEMKAQKVYGVAMLLMDRGHREKAVVKLREVLELDPGFCDAHIQLGHVYLEEGQVEDAIGEFTYVIKCDPNSNDAKLGLGMAHAKKGEADKAMEYFQSALQLNPRPERVYYEVGKVYEGKGELDKAVENYKLALKRLLGGH
jgi:tetratricopeptide (TPR) repeat protein